MIKIALLVWLGALFLAFLTGKGKGRTWMGRLFLGGFCLLVLGLFFKIISRVF